MEKVTSTCMLICTSVQRCAFLLIIFYQPFLILPNQLNEVFHRLLLMIIQMKISDGSLSFLYSYLMNEKREKKSLGLCPRVAKGKLNALTKKWNLMLRDIFVLKAWRMKLNYLGGIKDTSALNRYVSNDRHQLLQVITWFECNFKQISLMSVVENVLIIIGKVPAILKSIQKEFYYLWLCSEGLGCSSTTFVVLHLNCSVHSQLDLSKSFSGRWNKYLIELALGWYWRNIILKLINDSSSLNKGNHDCDSVWISDLTISIDLDELSFSFLRPQS